MTVLEHLVDRHLSPSVHRVWVDEEARVATFPLWNLSGQVVGYQTYRPDKDKQRDNDPRLSRYFTKKYTEIAVWGLESWDFSNTLFLTEGIFDAARMTWEGCSAIALISNDPNKAVKRWLWTVRQFRPVVALCDDDSAGRKLAKLGHRHHVAENHDIGDASPAEIAFITGRYT